MKWKWFAVLAGGLAGSLGAGQIALAQETASTPPPPTLDTGNTAWMLVSSALVLFMTAPGLAMFYGGLVRKKNVLSVIMQCVFLMGLMTCIWGIWGYSFAFSGTSPYIGNFDKVCLKGLIPSAPGGTFPLQGSYGIPELLFMAFQGMFFIITPGLICGAFAERMKFSAMCLFSILWGTLVYCPVAHWVWSDAGWLCEWNKDASFRAIDFAGGTVVHITSGISALVCAILLGKRLGFGQEPMPPHNLTYTSIGAAMLWVGWFGFNGGSALTAGNGAVNALVATHFAAAAGTLVWAGIEWLHRGKPSVLGACSGAVAGLVCITPASGSVTPMSGMIMGAIAGAVCFWACTSLKAALKYDDSLDAFGVHGVGGILGAVLTGVFATRLILPDSHGTPETPRGLLEGNGYQLVPQLVSIAASAGIAIVGTVILLKLIDWTIGLRVTPEQEVQGLDVTQHGEEGYIFY
jgi:Amt family ammonium transporter